MKSKKRGRESMGAMQTMTKEGAASSLRAWEGFLRQPFIGHVLRNLIWNLVFLGTLYCHINNHLI